jgi:hypothetical protein
MLPWEEKIYKICKERGYLVFQAHPFRPGIRRCNPNFIDGVEVYNGKTDKPSNDKALAWAEENNKLKCSGSDFHIVDNLAKGGIITEQKINNNNDLLQVLKAQKFTIVEEY